MPLEIITVPCLADNYAYLAHDPETGETAVIDIPEAGPILNALDARGWSADVILLTHHHHDHVQGVPDMLERFPQARVVGAEADQNRMPPLDLKVKEDSVVQVGAETGRVIDVSGHTVGHIAFYFPGSAALFSADSLMALGCGRLFEGTPEMMWESLSKMAALPPETMVYSGHEYTASNAKFALTVEPKNPELQKRAEEIATKRAKDEPTVPVSLETELKTNPFLRASNSDVKEALGMVHAADSSVFARIREMKDAF